MDVCITLDLTAVAESDAFDDVVDLAALAVSVRESVAAEPRKLLETIAVAAARDVLARYSLVRAVELRVTKPEPAGLDAAAESVELRLSR
jgi:dihydroneopterin aldolase